MQASRACSIYLEDYCKNEASCEARKSAAYLGSPQNFGIGSKVEVKHLPQPKHQSTET